MGCETRIWVVGLLWLVAITQHIWRNRNKTASLFWANCHGSNKNDSWQHRQNRLHPVVTFSRLPGPSLHLCSLLAQETQKPWAFCSCHLTCFNKSQNVGLAHRWLLCLPKNIDKPWTITSGVQLGKENPLSLEAVLGSALSQKADSLNSLLTLCSWCPQPES